MNNEVTDGFTEAKSMYIYLHVVHGLPLVSSKRSRSAEPLHVASRSRPIVSPFSTRAGHLEGLLTK